jgi:hypothetical protein
VKPLVRNRPSQAFVPGKTNGREFCHEPVHVTETARLAEEIRRSCLRFGSPTRERRNPGKKKWMPRGRRCRSRSPPPFRTAIPTRHVPFQTGPDTYRPEGQLAVAVKNIRAFSREPPPDAPHGFEPRTIKRPPRKNLMAPVRVRALPLTCVVQGLLAHASVAVSGMGNLGRAGPTAGSDACRCSGPSRTERVVCF